MRKPDFEIIAADGEATLAEMVARFEELAGTTLVPSSPEYLILRWGASIVTHQRVLINRAANQNIPSRAEGENLDALAEMLYGLSRPQAEPSKAHMYFGISEAQDYDIVIPKGTRVTDVSQTLYWETASAITISAGAVQGEGIVYCTTPGTIGNGYGAGAVSSIVDLFDYYAWCRNTTVTYGGKEAATDDELYELCRQAMSGYSTAGPRDAYIYRAKAADSDIGDVVVSSPKPGEVLLYLIDINGEMSNELLLKAYAACNGDSERPLTDKLTMGLPNQVTYDIDFTYFTFSGISESPTLIAEKIDNAVNEYVKWQGSRFGRDINPSVLLTYLMRTGIKRVDITSPTYTRLVRNVPDGSDNRPEVAHVGSITTTFGGAEDE